MIEEHRRTVGGKVREVGVELVEKDTGIRTTVVDDALSCAAFGSGKMLMNLNDMPEGMVNLARKRQMKA